MSSVALCGLVKIRNDLRPVKKLIHLQNPSISLLASFLKTSPTQPLPTKLQRNHSQLQASPCERVELVITSDLPPLTTQRNERKEKKKQLPGVQRRS